ncbi:MAG: type II toxin-antitoxin system HicB family antitoxin [Nitrospinae bacterium]|nr:type II toxin-antitoxin system HicB family antitoxin [Nitrospinota bacterium]MBI3815072.1 type II toxin-antitoxin system HicB family antitoxin [Nitrospinota bacterium]
MQKKIKYILYREGKYYVSQCLNVDVSSFGETMEEAATNLKEALELYFEDRDSGDFVKVDEVMLGERNSYRNF